MKAINLDISHSVTNLHIIADAHFLAFKGDCFGIVYSIAVFEHVQKTWVVADEICRVLRQGGHVVVELPFSNIIHNQHDYFRFTRKRICSLFDEKRFDVVLGQVSAGRGSFIFILLLQYVEQFIPSKYLKGLRRVTMGCPLSLLKYLDRLVERSPNLRRTGNSFTFIGSKR